MAKVCVVGAGAIGGVIAARMALAGHAVSVVARGEHLNAIRRDGLTLDDRLDGTRHTVRVQASDRVEDFAAQDLVVIGLKAPAIAPMLGRLTSLLDESTTVVPAINGLPWWYFHREGGRFNGARIECLDPHATMAADLDLRRVLGCVVHLAGEVPTPGVVAHTANRKLIIGEPSKQATDRLAQLADWWQACGFDVMVAPDIRHQIWLKLIGNLSFNPVGALTGYRSDQIIDDPAIRELISALMTEGKAVAEALGVTGLMEVEARIEMVRAIGRARASTLQDFEAGRRPEIEGLIGSVIEVAGWADVPVPTMRHLAALLTAKARTLGLLRD